jgi:hypothetical protein
MAFDRSSLQPLKNLIAEADWILQTTPPLPESRRTSRVKISAQRSPWRMIS